MITYEDFKNAINEMALNSQKINDRIDGILNQTLTFNEIKKNVGDFVSDIQNRIKNIKPSELNIEKIKNKDTLIFNIEYPHYIANEYNIMKDKLSKLKITSDQKIDLKTILFGSLDNQNSTNAIIQVYTNNFNQIHMIKGIPLSFQKLGLGKKIFYSILKKVGYFSAIEGSISNDVANIFLSFSKDKKIYSFQSDTKNIVFKSSMDINKIQKIVNEFFGDEDYDNDDNFEEKINKKYEN